jgi:hypothetical protein
MDQNAVNELHQIAHHIGYEWAMFLGATETSWHEHAPEAPRAPLHVVHKHARTELVWLHARILFDFLFKFKRRKNDLYVGDFLEGDAFKDWYREERWTAPKMCKVVDSNVERANKKLFHPTRRRLKDSCGLPDYTIVRDELRSAFSQVYGMLSIKS